MNFVVSGGSGIDHRDIDVLSFACGLPMDDGGQQAYETMQRSIGVCDRQRQILIVPATIGVRRLGC